jgi:probable rRNA maturation factor
VRRVNTPLLRRIVRSLLADLMGVENFELCVHLIATPEMVRLNETFMRHGGSTDVITFNHKTNEPTPCPSQEGNSISPRSRSSPPGRGQGWVLHGEIFVCVDEATLQARRFRTSWQSELVRYVVHGVLHLRGFDDQRPAARRKMKREENRLLRLLDVRFPLSRLARKPTLRS